MAALRSSRIVGLTHGRARRLCYISRMEFPLDLRFKLMALGSRLTVTDARGTLVYYVKQKAFKLKESVTVFADEGQTRPLYTINADRIVDVSARYRVTDQGGSEVAVVLRIVNRPAFFQGLFRIEAMHLSATESLEVAVVSVLMMVLLERMRW